MSKAGCDVGSPDALINSENPTVPRRSLAGANNPTQGPVVMNILKKPFGSNSLVNSKKHEGSSSSFGLPSGPARSSPSLDSLPIAGLGDASNNLVEIIPTVESKEVHTLNQVTFFNKLSTSCSCPRRFFLLLQFTD